MIRTLEESDMKDEKYDERLWRLMVDKVIVGIDGKPTCTLRNGVEIEA